MKEIQGQTYDFFDWEHLLARAKWKIKHDMNKDMKNINFSTIFKYKNACMAPLSHYHAR